MENDILVLLCRQFAYADPLKGSQGAPGNGVNAKHLLSVGKVASESCQFYAKTYLNEVRAHWL